MLELLRKSTGVDFSHYKVNTIQRRINRRMLLLKFESSKAYLNYLKQSVPEIQLLYQDLLINVTSFFRDPDALEYLKKTILPKIIKAKRTNEVLRIWVPACSTGEEAYSLAMILHEIAGENISHLSIQIFATDLSEAAIAKARMGLYSKMEVERVSPKRMQRFFLKVDSSYRIVKSIRDLCVFAPHNVFRDPPFSHLDLISCCNLMIYLDNALQNKILYTFHYALNASGYLVLGKSETIGSATGLFNQMERKYKVYSKKKEVASKARFELKWPHGENPGTGTQKTVSRRAPKQELSRINELERLSMTLCCNGICRPVWWSMKIWRSCNSAARRVFSSSLRRAKRASIY
jgi:chemotaxis methyl-accepting protein methylase